MRFSPASFHFVSWHVPLLCCLECEPPLFSYLFGVLTCPSAFDRMRVPPIISFPFIQWPNLSLPTCCPECEYPSIARILLVSSLVPSSLSSVCEFRSTHLLIWVFLLLAPPSAFDRKWVSLPLPLAFKFSMSWRDPPSTLSRTWVRFARLFSM
jgi:hypothetical protein